MSVAGPRRSAAMIMIITVEDDDLIGHEHSPTILSHLR